MRQAGDAVRLTVGGGVLLVTCVLWLTLAEVATAGGETAFVPLTPCRVVDTRGNGFSDPFGPPALAAGVSRDFQIRFQCGIPAEASAVSLNVTAANAQGPGFLLLYPQGGAQPLVSTLNYLTGETVANAAIVPLGPGGVTIVAGVAATDLVLDVNGYFRDSLVHEEAGLGTLFVGLGASNLHSTAVGYGVLTSNTTGGSNTAMGQYALTSNLSGTNNTAIGANVLMSNTAGSRNTAVGLDALKQNTEGDGNIVLGWLSGTQTTGNNNIVIGNPGVAGENDTIRLGGDHQKIYIAGIHGKTPDFAAVAVFIDSLGQLGTTSSSRRTKTDIADLGERSGRLHALRPVSFRYQVHPSDGPVEYGLIAEEVAEVYPELVIRDAEGAPETVRYHLLPALLLNELQRVVAEKDRQLAELAATVAELAGRLARLEGAGPIAVGRRADRGSADAP